MTTYAKQLPRPMLVGLLASGLILSACSQAAPEATTDTAEIPVTTPAASPVEQPPVIKAAIINPSDTTLPALTAYGSEPAWSAKWDGETLTFVFGTSEDVSVFKDPIVFERANGWRISTPAKLAITVSEIPCKDLSGKEHPFDVKISRAGQTHFGCADLIES